MLVLGASLQVLVLHVVALLFALRLAGDFQGWRSPLKLCSLDVGHWRRVSRDCIGRGRFVHAGLLLLVVLGWEPLEPVALQVDRSAGLGLGNDLGRLGKAHRVQLGDHLPEEGVVAESLLAQNRVAVDYGIEDLFLLQLVRHAVYLAYRRVGDVRVARAYRGRARSRSQHDLRAPPAELQVAPGR